MPTSGFGTYLANKSGDHFLGGPDYVRVPSVFLHLWTTMPDRNKAGGAEISAAIFPSYPLEVVNDAVNFPAMVDGLKHNGADWAFGIASAPTGTMPGLTIEDGAGNLLYYGLFASPVSVLAGVPFTLPAGQATIKHRLDD